MTIYEILRNIDVQTPYKIVVYDEEKDEIFEIKDNSENRHKIISCLYENDGYIYFEVEG